MHHYPTNLLWQAVQYNPFDICPIVYRNVSKVRVCNVNGTKLILPSHRTDYKMHQIIWAIGNLIPMNGIVFLPLN